MPKSKRTPKKTKAPPNRLKHYRVQKLLSRAELANKAGVSIAVIEKIENGKTNPRIATKRKLIAGLGMTVDQAELVFPHYED